MTTNVTKTAFTYANRRYFRTGSESLQLGSFGQKKSRLTQANYLAVEDTVAAGNLAKVDIKVTGPYSIDWSKLSSSEVNAEISYLKLAGGKGAFTHQAAKSADLKLVKMELAEADLKKLLNEYAGKARRYLDDEGGDARIVSAVWVVMEAKLATQVTNGATGSVSVPVGGTGFAVDVGGGSSSTTKSEVVIPPQTTFAYLLHKVKKWNGSGKDRTVDDVEDDHQSLN